MSAPTPVSALLVFVGMGLLEVAVAALCLVIAKRWLFRTPHAELCPNCQRRLALTQEAAHDCDYIHAHR